MGTRSFVLVRTGMRAFRHAMVPQEVRHRIDNNVSRKKETAHRAPLFLLAVLSVRLPSDLQSIQGGAVLSRRSILYASTMRVELR